MLMIIGFGIVVVGIAFYKYSEIKAMGAKFASMGPSPEAITTAQSTEEVWTQSLDVVGEFAPVQGVTLAAEAAGKISKIHFTSGAKVQEGDLLIEQDTTVEEPTYQAAAAQAQLARLSFDRGRRLQADNATTQADLDSQESSLRQFEEAAKTLQATLDRKKIRAPFSGRVGIRQVQLGQFLNPGQLIVSLQALDQVYVNFTLPQQELSHLRLQQTVELTVDVYPGEIFKGVVNAIEPDIDTATRNVRVQGLVNNEGERILPGMFARVKLLTGVENKRVTVPQTAIARAPYGDSVFIVESMKDPQGKAYDGVRQQVIKIGPTRGDQVAVLEGLKAGETVVTSGLFKLRPGGAVLINNTIGPTNNPAPKPTNS
jgi:membrane fusion protein, multidrug efflux system